MAKHAVLIGPKPYPVEKQPVKAFYVPFGDQVAVTPWDASGVTNTGLMLPDGTKEVYETALAMVVAVGPDCKQVAAGDVILLTIQTPAVNVFSQGVKLTQTMEKYVVGVVSDPDSLPGRWRDAPAE